MFLNELPRVNSIKIGSLSYKPKKGIEGRIADSVRLVTMEDSAHPEYLGYRGSCTLVKNGTENFITCTRHQIGLKKGETPDTRTLESLRFVSHINSNFAKNIPSNNCLFVADSEEEEIHDILLFHVPTDHKEFLPERSNFFPLQKFSLLDRHASWIVGCPTLLTEVKYDPLSIHCVTQMIGCTFNPNFKTNARSFKQVTYDKLKADMDGFSGGAVFSLVEGEQGWEIVFDGIVVRAGNGVAHFVDSSFIMQATKEFREAPKSGTAI